MVLAAIEHNGGYIPVLRPKSKRSNPSNTSLFDTKEDAFRFLENKFRHSKANLRGVALDPTTKVVIGGISL